MKLCPHFPWNESVTDLICIHNCQVNLCVFYQSKPNASPKRCTTEKLFERWCPKPIKRKLLILLLHTWIQAHSNLFLQYFLCKKSTGIMTIMRLLHQIMACCIAKSVSEMQCRSVCMSMLEWDRQEVCTCVYIPHMCKGTQYIKQLNRFNESNFLDRILCELTILLEKCKNTFIIQRTQNAVTTNSLLYPSLGKYNLLHTAAPTHTLRSATSCHEYLLCFSSFIYYTREHTKYSTYQSYPQPCFLVHSCLDLASMLKCIMGQ